MFKEFMKKNLEAAEERGTDEQSNDMAYLVAASSHYAGELSDFMGGRRKLGDHPHHTPKDLADTVIKGVVTMTKIRREIER